MRGDQPEALRAGPERARRSASGTRRRRSGSKKPRDPELEKLGREAEHELEKWARGAPGARAPRRDPTIRRRLEPKPRRTATREESSSSPFDAIFPPFEKAASPARLGGCGAARSRGRRHPARRPAEARQRACSRSGWRRSSRAGCSRATTSGSPARTLLIAAEDPVDTIVKGRLIAAAADESLVGTLASRPSRPSTTIDHQARDDLDGLDGLDGPGRSPEGSRSPMNTSFSSKSWSRTRSRSSCSTRSTASSAHKIDAHRDVEIRRVLDPLAALCRHAGTSRRSPSST